MKITLPRLLRPLAVTTVLAISAGIGLVSVPLAEADSTTFIASVSGYAQQTQRDFGVPASVSIAQSILESGWGGSSLSSQYNNYFGIKCNANISPYMSGCVEKASIEYIGTVQTTIVSKFRTYATVLNSFLDHANILKLNSRYAPAFQYTANPDQFAREVAAAGYATDPNYATLLISIMSKYNLYQYDSAATTMAATVTIPEFPTLSYGTTNYRVQAAQYLLQARGIYVPATGFFGSMTQAAVKKFQTSIGRSATGTLDPATFARLVVSVTYGSSGNGVKALQVTLNARGFTVPVTGYYGSITRAQTAALQQQAGITTTRSLIDKTNWALFLAP